MHRVHLPSSLRPLAAACVLALAACGEPPPPPPIPETTAVFVAPAAIELRAGETVQIAAQANDDAGRAIGGAELEFVSSAPAIADVTHQGLVSSTGPVGAAEIRVLSSRAETKVPVTVRPGEPRALVAAPEESTGPAPAAGAAASAPRVFAVRALDAFGNPVPGIEVAFRVVAGEGSVAPAAETTDAAGVARTRWTAGTEPGEHALEASAAGAPPLVDRVLRAEAAEADSEPGPARR